MKKSKLNAQKTLALLFILLLAGFTIITYWLGATINNNRKDWVISIVEQEYKTNKLGFCLNNSITPCSDTAITNWNNSHPDNTFYLKSEQQLVEQGIEEHRISQK